MNILAPLTATDLLQAGRWFQRAGHLFEITAWNPREPLHVEARLAETGTTHIFTLPELFASKPPTRFAATRQELEAKTTAETAPPMGSASVTALPVHLLSRADHIIQTVEAVQAHMEAIGRRLQIAGKSLSADRDHPPGLPGPTGPYLAQRLLRLPAPVPGAARRPCAHRRGAPPEHLW